MDVDLRAYRRKDYVRAARGMNLKWGKEIKKLRRIITRIMDSHKENADSELYLDFGSPFASANAHMVTMARAQQSSSLLLILITLLFVSSSFSMANRPFLSLPEPLPGS